MVRILGFVIWILIVVLPGCGPDPVDDGRFHYDEGTGRCLNFSGTVGFNEIVLEDIRRSKDCECMKFTKIEVIDLLGDTTTIVHRFGYNELVGYNFRGAVFDSSYLYFNEIVKADLRGADLSTLQYGYAFVSGRIDVFTKVPIEGVITIEGDSLVCYN